MPTLYMMVGVPCSGKSTYVDDYMIHEPGAELLCTDDVIERLAKMAHSTYSEMFSSCIKTADIVLHKRLAYAIEKNISIFWDQTNLTPTSRRSKLAKIPTHYKKVAVVMQLPPEEVLIERNAKRALSGKLLSGDLMESMIRNFEVPTTDEGFDEIIHVHYKEKVLDS